jgi:hypothetical protein
MTYAKETTVPVEKSRMEIEQLLRKRGATSFVSGWEEGRSVIQCNIHDRTVRFVVTMPLRNDHLRDGRGRTRSLVQVTHAVEQAERARWRATLLVIKAKLEAVELGIETFEETFLANIVLANGSTMGQWAVPEIARIYESGGELPSLLALPRWSSE